MPASLKCPTKLPGHGIWMTMGSTGTLESVEFLDVVGGDLEVPPDENFGLKKKSSKNLLTSGERCRIFPSNWSPLSQDELKAAPDTRVLTATSTASSRAWATGPGTLESHHNSSLLFAAK